MPGGASENKDNSSVVVETGKSYRVEGSVAPGYEPVRRMFESNFERGLEANAQCCAYVRGKKVVDLWGSSPSSSDEKYNGDSIQTIFSSSKSLAAIAVATLVDQGLIDYGDRLTSVWPEFGQNGKGNVTLADVLRHESGVARFNEPFPLSAVYGENIKKNAMGKILERQKQRFPPPEAGTTRQYHSLTRGFLLNEVFRRLDKNGRTIGEFYREQVSNRLNVDVFYGIGDQEMSRLSHLSTWPLSKVIFQTALPDSLGSQVPLTTHGYSETLVWLSRKDATLRGEFPSANAVCSARGLARLAAIMANEGELDGTRLMSKETWHKMHAFPILKKDYGQVEPGLSPSQFTQGGLAYFGEVEGEREKGKDVRKLRRGFYGWLGMGGSVFQWNPSQRIGFAYAPTLILWYCTNNVKAAKLQHEVVRCTEEIEKAETSDSV